MKILIEHSLNKITFNGFNFDEKDKETIIKFQLIIFIIYISNSYSYFGRLQPNQNRIHPDELLNYL